MSRIHKPKWSPNSVYRTTKCFSPQTNGYPGGFPINFLKWVRTQGWWGKDRCYLCAGGAEDPDAVRVDIRPEAHPTHLEDARHTSLASESFDWICIDPPYTQELADSLYQTGEVWSNINAFTKEAARICRPDGLIVTLSYEVPKRIAGFNLIACCGIYQAINVAHMRCFTVWRKIQKAAEEVLF